LNNIEKFYFVNSLQPGNLPGFFYF